MHHLVDQDAQRPPICSFIVSFTLQYLWGQVFGCSAKGFSNLSVPYDLCHAKISQTNVTVIIHENVFQF
jgi:hypothetical protein